MIFGLFSELGDRWAPTILETQDESVFVLNTQVMTCGEYWIGGSTNQTPVQSGFQHTDYISDDSGTEIVLITKINYYVRTNQKGRNYIK